MSKNTVLTTKLYDVILAQETFIPPNSDESIDYYQLVLLVKLAGEEQEVRVKLTKVQYQILLLADKAETDLFAEDIVTPETKK